MGRRRAFWAAVVVAVLAVATGGAIAASGSAAHPGPATVVGDYFAALQRGDAPAALALGPVPNGARILLTSAVLREQQRAAPIRDVTIAPATTRGARASVRVRYHLGFAAGSVAVSDAIGLRRHGTTWKLDRSAAVTTLTLAPSGQRATLLRGTVPAQPVPMFPGAVPIRFDSPFLELSPAADSVVFGQPLTQLQVEDTAAGRRAVTAAVLAALHACLTGHAPTADLAAASSTCPEPDERVIPGSVRGRITGALQHSKVFLRPTPVGQFELDASVPTRVTYQRLDFRNTVQTQSGRELISLHAVAFAVAPVRIRWIR